MKAYCDENKVVGCGIWLQRRRELWLHGSLRRLGDTFVCRLLNVKLTPIYVPVSSNIVIVIMKWSSSSLGGVFCVDIYSASCGL